ncbi:MAG: hypothetical protein Q9216_006962 [Gyalolechia sp. 2 TL-2023]
MTTSPIGTSDIRTCTVTRRMRPSRPQAVSRSSTSSQRSQKSFRRAFNPLDDPRPVPFVFPENHHLIITTAQSIYTYDYHGITQIFSSLTNRIVAAKRASHGPKILAVADGQVVILHDVRKGMQKSCLLREEDGCIRTLRYAKDPDRLLFTTTLQSTVQAYDLEDFRLLDPIHRHPSPPNVFALSSTSHLLLSASASPTVIQLTSFLLKFRSLLLRPQCSSSDVVAVEFHPERGNLFLLAFADGTCAMYDAAPLFRGSIGADTKSNTLKTDAGWEISHIKGLHAPDKTKSQTPIDNNPRPHNVGASVSTSGGDRGLGITAVGLVPGYKMIAATVGLDGRCCVVDFTASEDRKATLLGSWDVGGPATCLSILTPSPQSGLVLPVAGLTHHDLAYRTSIIAIGRQDGQVLLFDLDGNLLMHRITLPSGYGIIGVEWMEGKDWPEPLRPRPADPVLGKYHHLANRKSLGSVLAGGRSVAEEVETVTGGSGAGKGSRETETGVMDTPGLVSGIVENNFDPAKDGIRIQHSPAINYLDLPSAVKKQFPMETNYEDTSGRADTSSSGSLGEILKNFQFPSPPHGNNARVLPQHQWARGQLPKNNSWAAEGRPHNSITEKEGHSLHSSETDVIVQENSKKAAFGSGRRKRRALEDLRNRPARVPTGRPIEQHEELWTDIAFDDEPSIKSMGSTGKENRIHKDGSNTADNDAMNVKLSSRDRNDQASKAEGGDGVPFAIHVDERDRSNHPQPLSAHPGKVPTSGPRPLGPTNVNSSHQASVSRVPFYRQRYKNGKLENHRSSIYGPGVLARKVQQEVMITVNFELDVLRREMSEKFTEQRKWFVKELMNSQEWTLRVEEENRQLREELAKERKKKAADREVTRTLC